MTYRFFSNPCRFFSLLLILFFTAGLSLSAFAGNDNHGRSSGTVRPGGDKKINAEYAAALRFIKKEQYREALPCLEAAMEKMKNTAAVQADYLLCLVWTGNYKQAVDFYLRHEKQLADVSYVQRNAAKAFFEIGDYGRARLLYTQAMLREPSDSEALKGLIYSLCHLGDFTGAHQALGQRARTGSFPPAYLSSLKLHVYQQEGNHAGAYLHALQELLSELKEARIKELQDSKRHAAANLSNEEMDGLLREQQENPVLHDMIAIDRGRYEVLINPRPSEKDFLPPGILLEMARGYFKSGKDDESLALYRLLITRQPDSCLAHMGAVYPLSNTGQFEEAAKEVDIARRSGCDYAETLFAEAFLHEKQGDFLKAAGVYDELLTANSSNRTARKLKMRTLADLGAISYAYQQSMQEGLADEQFFTDLQGDGALDRLRWKEAEQAIPLLEKQLLDDPSNVRARCDYLVALREKDRMREVLEQYEILKGINREIPCWALNAAADACLYLEKPKQAVALYKECLDRNPADPFNLLMGLFYAYQDLRDWDNAEQTWKRIDEHMQSGTELKKWQRLEAVSARGWYLVYRDELREAEDYFESHVAQAGMNTGFRAGLGHTYRLRGWSRKSLEEFRIAHAIYPKDVDVETGTILALNELNYKEEARAEATKLLRMFPTNKHVLDTLELLQVEDMNAWTTETRFLDENEGATEYWVKSIVEEPLHPFFKLYQEIVWQETYEENTPEGKQEFEWKRAGIGHEWIVLPQLVWKEAVTFDFEEFDELGYYTTLSWMPTDGLSLAAGYDSFYLDIPLRARAKGIEGESSFLNVHYHQSDERYFGAGTGYIWYDDGNLNTYYRLYGDQSVLNTPDFKIRLGAELYHSRNRESHKEYFSPSHDLSLALTPTIHWIHLLRYDKEVRSSLHPRLGAYRQNTYACHTIGGATYEQLIRLSKTFELTWAVSWDRKIYDGESTNVWGGFFRFKKNF